MFWWPRFWQWFGTCTLSGWKPSSGRPWLVFQTRDFKGLGRWGTRTAMIARLSSQFGFSEFHEVFGSEVSVTRPGSGHICKCDVKGCI